MFGLGMQEIIIILVLALIIFGPSKLPNLGKSLGRGIMEFKKAANELKKEIEVPVQEVRSTVQGVETKNEAV